MRAEHDGAKSHGDHEETTPEAVGEPDQTTGRRRSTAPRALQAQQRRGDCTAAEGIIRGRGLQQRADLSWNFRPERAEGAAAVADAPEGAGSERRHEEETWQTSQAS